MHLTCAQPKAPPSQFQSSIFTRLSRARTPRFHRCDHMGYVQPAEALTLLEGFEEEAEGLARKKQQQVC